MSSVPVVFIKNEGFTCKNQPNDENRCKSRELPNSNRNISIKMKFKVLEYNEYVLIKLGMFSNRDSETRRQSNDFFRCLQSWKMCYIFLISSAFAISSAWYAYQNSDQFSLVLRTCEMMLGSIQAVCMLVAFCMNTSKLQDVHLKLQTLVNKTTSEGMI